MHIPKWLQFPTGSYGESTWRRAWVDFDQFRSSIWGFVMIELIAVTIGAAGFLWRFASSDDSPTVQFLWGALGVIVGVIVSCLILYGFNVILAPYRQRNEARVAELAPLSVTDLLRIEQACPENDVCKFVGIKCINRVQADAEDVSVFVHSIEVHWDDLGDYWHPLKQFGEQEFPSMEGGWPNGENRRTVGIGRDATWSFVRLHESDNQAILTSRSMSSGSVPLVANALHRLDVSVGAKGVRPHRQYWYVRWGSNGTYKLMGQLIRDRWLRISPEEQSGLDTEVSPTESVLTANG